MSRILNKKSLEDIVIGATFLGTGGGGSIKTGLQIVKDVLDNVEIVSLDEVEDDAVIVVAEGMGSPEVMLEKGFTSQTANAFEALQKHTGKKIDYVIPVETGAGNSITPMTVSAEKDIPVIDADGAGRAIPELQQTTFSIYGIPMCPAALADDQDNWVIVNLNDPYLMEDLGRSITTEFGQQAGLVWHMMKGKEMKEVVIPDALSIAEEVGRAIRESKENEKDSVDAVIRVLEGQELLRGEVTKKTTDTREGFDYGEVLIENGKDKLKVLYKNENMLAYRNGKLAAMVPDRISWITTDGEPLTNADIEEGMEVACIGMEAHEKWTTKKAISTFKRVLEELGYDDEYRPLSKLIE